MKKEITQPLIKDDYKQFREAELPASEAGMYRGISVGVVSKGNWRDSVKHLVVIKKMDEE